jgi:hypothetical protein
MRPALAIFENPENRKNFRPAGLAVRSKISRNRKKSVRGDPSGLGSSPSSENRPPGPGRNIAAVTPGFSSTARPSKWWDGMLLVTLAILGAVAVVSLDAMLAWTRFC